MSATRIVFTSHATDLGPNDTVVTCNGDCADVYVRDLRSGTTEMVSVNAAGTNGGNNESFLPVISPDGTKVAFTSMANDLVPGANTLGPDLYLRDLTTDTTILISQDDCCYFNAFDAVFSDDSRRLAFDTPQAHPGTVDTNEWDDVYVRGLATGATALVSVNAAGTNGGNSGSQVPLFSPTGNAIAFDSLASDLSPIGSSGYGDMYLRDLTTGTTSMVTLDAWGTSGMNDGYSAPAFSPDGTKIAFTTRADDLGPTDTNERDDVYVRDLVHRSTSLISLDRTNRESGAGGSFGIWGGFSPDSTRYLFSSDAPDLVEHDSNGQRDAFVRDLATETTTMISVNGQGTNGANARTVPEAFSPDGQKVLLWSLASDLGPADDDDLPDLYLRDLAAGTTTLVTTNAAESVVGFFLARFFYTPNGIVFAGDTGTLGPTDTNVDVDVYVARPADR